MSYNLEQGCLGQGKIQESLIFSSSGNFIFSQGILEEKKEKSGNSKFSKQFAFGNFIFHKFIF